MIVDVGGRGCSDLAAEIYVGGRVGLVGDGIFSRWGGFFPQCGCAKTLD